MQLLPTLLDKFKIMLPDLPLVLSKLIKIVRIFCGKLTSFEDVLQNFLEYSGFPIFQISHLLYLDFIVPTGDWAYIIIYMIQF